MIKRIQIKVCGLTRPDDADLAVELGAEFLGFIFYKKSPRFIEPKTYRMHREKIPPTKRVYVQVRPEPAELREATEEGFDFYQLHFPVAEDFRLVEAWSEIVGPERLWLAPKISPKEEFPERLLPCAETFLIDTYRKEGFGGTGETGDWWRFREWSLAAPEKRWILAGGLKPENVHAAIDQTKTAIVDVSSGIEKRPGEKDPSRMRAFFGAVREAEKPGATSRS